MGRRHVACTRRRDLVGAMEERDMKKRVKHSVLAAGLLALFWAAVPAEAGDWTLAGASCEASLGSGGPDGKQAFVAEGGTAVAVCPFVKSGGSDNLSLAWVRWQRMGAPN